MGTTATTTTTGHRALGLVTIAAGVLSLLSLVVGLSGADYDFEAFASAETYLALGADAAGPVAAGLWLSVFGSYVLVVPLMLHLWRTHRGSGASLADLSGVGGLTYVLLGAAGGAVLASVHPDLLREYSTADPALHAELLTRFDLVRRIAEDGLQGVVQNVAGAAFFLGAGLQLRPTARLRGVLALVVGVALALNTLAILVDVEALRTIGLSATVLLAPVWYVLTGAALTRR